MVFKLFRSHGSGIEFLEEVDLLWFELPFPPSAAGSGSCTFAMPELVGGLAFAVFFLALVPEVVLFIKPLSHFNHKRSCYQQHAYK